ncbi:PSP1 C-terminal conserved region-domain-containing protein [Geranomyces variabilis]|nr:PSP1 C-terminal conserved region-domain-containing protein [Geranomyces variabilis]
MDALRLEDTSETPFLDEIDDYFENTKRRTKAWVEAGKNLQAQSYPHQWPLYVVEFKAGRTDFFHVADLTGAPIMKGDLVIVEADRGKDLGKVIADDIESLQQLQLYQSQHADTLVDSHNANKEVHPKRIYRSAAPAEVTMLVAKSQDEAKAMALCQTKIRQKKLPMEIVDAEYQWDRRKLTFYFVADRRIDFRELVRELFKIYKTRIWMYVTDALPWFASFSLTLCE